MAKRSVKKIQETLSRGPGSLFEDKQSTRLLSTGSSLLNLACTGDVAGGFSTGRYFFIVGDSASGKTFLSLTCFAEACQNPAFDEHRLIFDDVEGGALMPLEKFFGKAVAQRVEPPRREEGLARCSQTIEEFYANLSDALAGDRPCIYVLDSMDALSSEYEREKTEERKAATRKGARAKGDYGDGKAKRNSSGIRSHLSLLRDTGSILIVLNQTRDNINAGPFESSKTRSGGHALTFYATTELWSSVGGQIKKTVRDQERVVGVQSKIQVKKNRFTGRKRTVTIPIYYDYGIDDIGSCIDFLIREKRWLKKAAGLIDCKKDLPGKEKPLRRSTLIQWIESENLQQHLQSLVQTVWDEVEEACSEKRIPRYQ